MEDKNALITIDSNGDVIFRNVEFVAKYVPGGVESYVRITNKPGVLSDLLIVLLTTGKNMVSNENRLELQRQTAIFMAKLHDA